MKEGEQNFKNSGRHRRRKKYERELATQIKREYEVNPPLTGNELEYTGGAKDFVEAVDRIILSGKHLTDEEKIQWLSIFRYHQNPDPTCRVFWPGREGLAIITGKGVRQVTIRNSKLTAKGLLLIKRRAGKPALYLLNDPPKEWMEETLKKLKEKKT